MPSRLARWATGTAVLAATAFSITGPATSASAATDTTAPAVTAPVFTPSSVDDTTGDTLSMLKLHITDASGFNAGLITLASGSTTLDPIDFNNSSRTAGTTYAGDYVVEIDIPQGTPSGAYVPTVQSTDTKSNTGSTTLAAAMLTVTRTPDTAPPMLAGSVQVTPDSVGVTSNTQTVTYSAHLTDNVSGVSDASITITAPDGGQKFLTLTRASGTVTDGVWSAGLDLPTSAPRGTWTVSQLAVHDAYGNFLSSANGLGGVLNVTGAVDTVGPKLISVTPAVTSADASSSRVPVRLSVHSTDDASGIAFGTLTFSSPDGSQSVTCHFGHSPDSGSPTDGIWRPIVVFPARAQGNWTLTEADVFDAQNNETFYGRDATEPPPSSVTLGSGNDETAPTVTSLTLGPTEVTTAYTDGEATVDGQVSFLDDLSGLDTVDIALRGPDGTVDPDLDLTADTDDDLSEGSTNNGTLSFRETVPQAAAGVWTVDSVTVTDHAGNSAVYGGAALGSPSFTVTAVAADTLAPTLTALTIAPQSVNPGDDVTVTLAANDPDAHPSGIEGGSVVLQPASGTADDAVEFDLANAPVRGNDVNGTYVVAQAPDASASTGTWNVVSVTLNDRAGNTTTLTGNQVADALGSAPTLVVGDGPIDDAPVSTAPFAPSSVRAVAGAGSASITFARADDGGSAITGYRVAASTGGGSCVTAGPDQTACTIDGLRNGMDYSFTVTATNAVGTSAPSAPSPVVTPRAGTRLAITSARTSVRAGSVAKVSGALVRTDIAGSASGQTVLLQYRRAGSTGSFTTFSVRAKTSSAGSIVFTTFRPRYTVEVRLYFSTAGAYRGSVSANRKISVVH